MHYILVRSRALWDWLLASNAIHATGLLVIITQGYFAAVIFTFAPSISTVVFLSASIG